MDPAARAILASGSQLNALHGMLEALEKDVKAVKSQLGRSSLDKLAERLQTLEAAVAQASSKASWLKSALVGSCPSLLWSAIP